MRLSFMVLDIDVDAAYSGKYVDGGAPVADDTACVWGTTPAGESVCAVVDPTSFFTYFYIPAPDKCGDAPFAAEHCSAFSSTLRAALAKEKGTAALAAVVVDAELEYHTPLMFYRPDAPGKQAYLKIYATNHAQMKKLSQSVQALAGNGGLEDFKWPVKRPEACENTVKFLQKLMTDLLINSGSWLDVDVPDFAFVPRGAAGRVSTCVYEFMLPAPVYRAGVRPDSVGLPPLKTLAFDIAVLRSGTGAPNRAIVPATDRVITISNMLLYGEHRCCVVFALCPPGAELVPSLSSQWGAVSVRCFPTEGDMLLAWQRFVHDEVDPDVITGFDICGHDLRFMLERYRVLKLGVLDLSRSHDVSKLAIQAVTNYRKEWVRSQSRMSAISNQVSFKAKGVRGRLVLDVLRPLLVTQKLSYFTLTEACSVLLKFHKETLDQACMDGLLSGHRPAGVVRAALYCLADADAAVRVSNVVQAIPDAFELARVTGLSYTQVSYQAQMIRTLSLLLRSCRQHGYVLAGPHIPANLENGPFLYHPNNATPPTAPFLYSSPVAVFDFASLYPSLYQAYNLCYSTLLLDEDLSVVGDDAYTLCPTSTRTGAGFVNRGVRQGLLPLILSQLIAARNKAKADMAAAGTDAALAQAFDCRQRALKTCANALYGFTGASSSPFPCGPLAESCVHMGASTCRRAKAIIESKFPHARIIYGQTDSLFVLLDGFSVPDAVAFGHQCAEVVTQTIGAPPVKLLFERVMCPFLLLEVNRYAGVAYTQASLTTSPPVGDLLVKGIESERRSEMPYLRQLVKHVLMTALSKGDPDASLEDAKRWIIRLLRGDVVLTDLVFTAALWRETGADITKHAATYKPDAPSGSKGSQPTTPHVALAARIAAADPTHEFLLGQRIPYVFVQRDAGVTLQAAKAEEPEVALARNYTPDYQLYFKNKMMESLRKIFEPIVGVPATKELLNGPHTKVTPAQSSTATSNQTKLAGFFSVAKPHRCLGLGCASRLATPEPLCEDCLSRMGAEPGVVPLAYLAVMQTFRESEQRLAAVHSARTRTQRSAPSATPPACSNWQYALAKAAQDLDRCVEQLGRCEGLPVTPPAVCSHGSGPDCVRCAMIQGMLREPVGISHAAPHKKNKHVDREVVAPSREPLRCDEQPTTGHPAGAHGVEAVGPAPEAQKVAAEAGTAVVGRPDAVHATTAARAGRKAVPVLSAAKAELPREDSVVVLDDESVVPAVPAVTTAAAKPKNRARRRWPCPTCTFVNKSTVTVCEACDAARPDE